MINKLILILLSVFSTSAIAEDGWVKVQPREREAIRIPEDGGIWVIFAKNFEEERVRLKFPADPTCLWTDGWFSASSKAVHSEHQGEVTLLARPRSADTALSKERLGDLVYWDVIKQAWMHERYIVTSQCEYILRVATASQESPLFHQFAESLEIE